MAYDEGLATRLREMLEGERDITERKMFGGLAFMERGHMFVGIIGEKLMVRAGPDSYQNLLKQRHVSVMDFAGRPMTSFLYVAPKGYESDQQLQNWVDQTRAFVATLPAKKK